MDASESSTSAKKYEDSPNLWQTLHRDLSLQNMSSLVTNLDNSDSDNSIFVTASKVFSKNEIPTYQQIEAYNVIKLKVTTPTEIPWKFVRKNEIQPKMDRFDHKMRQIS